MCRRMNIGTYNIQDGDLGILMEQGVIFGMEADGWGSVQRVGMSISGRWTCSETLGDAADGLPLTRAFSKEVYRRPASHTKSNAV